MRIEPASKPVRSDGVGWHTYHVGKLDVWVDFEFRKHQRSAEQRRISREQFINEYNNSDNFPPELPSSNRGHSIELPEETFLTDEQN